MERILLIDDDFDDAELFEEALKEVAPQIQFIHISDGKEAVLTMENSAIPLPDLIFLDINIPSFSGWECLTTFKKNTRIKDLPVIMYSTSARSTEKQIAADLGAAGFIMKPNDFNFLKRTLDYLLCNTTVPLDERIKTLY